MKACTFRGEDGHITISVDPTKVTDDNAVDGTVDLKAGNYRIKSKIYVAVPELNRLFTDLKRLLESGKGALIFTNHINERNIEFNLSFEPDEKSMMIQGIFVESPERTNELFFKIKSNKKEIQASLKELENIIIHLKRE